MEALYLVGGVEGLIQRGKQAKHTGAGAGHAGEPALGLALKNINDLLDLRHQPDGRWLQIIPAGGEEGDKVLHGQWA